MSTEYRFVNTARKKQTLELREFLKQERDALTERINQWGQGTVENGILELAQQAAQELGGFPSRVDFDYVEPNHVIGSQAAKEFKWQVENSFFSTEDVAAFLHSHSEFVIEDEYGNEFTITSFKRAISGAAKTVVRTYGIPIRHGNFQDILASDADRIVLLADCMGAMDSAFGKVIKETYPSIYYDYTVCTRSFTEPTLLLGKMYLKKIDMGRDIALAFGQAAPEHGEVDPDYTAIQNALSRLRSISSDEKIAIPYKMGCNLDSASWAHILSIIETEFKDYGDEVEIWAQEGETEFVLYDRDLGCYSGRNKKYSDMVDFTIKKGALRFKSKEDAQGIIDWLKKRTLQPSVH